MSVTATSYSGNGRVAALLSPAPDGTEHFFRDRNPPPMASARRHHVATWRLGRRRHGLAQRRIGCRPEPLAGHIWWKVVDRPSVAQGRRPVHFSASKLSIFDHLIDDDVVQTVVLDPCRP
jgi:hypothetical protein